MDDASLTPGDQIPPFHVMEMAREAFAMEAEGREVFHLEVGQPSTRAPATARAAAHDALDNDTLAYTNAHGLTELRERIARFYADTHDIEVPPDRISVSTGASGSCVLAFLALFRPGDRVAVIEPGYPCYRNDLLAFGIEPVAVPVDSSTEFRPTPELLDAAGPLDGLVLASPSNPTGTVLDRQHLEPLLSWAAEASVTVIVDEIYHGITYDSPAPTALSIDTDAELVVFNSFSKYWSMTGWRLGWLVAPAQRMGAIERLGQNLAISAPTLSQLAGIAAFDATEECEANRARYEVNRRVVLDALPKIGLEATAPPDGAFYVWCDVSTLLDDRWPDSNALCREWLRATGVATTPGIDFDPPRGDRFVRFSYAASTEIVSEAMARLTTWFADTRS